MFHSSLTKQEECWGGEGGTEGAEEAVYDGGHHVVEPQVPQDPQHRHKDQRVRHNAPHHLHKGSVLPNLYQDFSAKLA